MALLIAVLMLQIRYYAPHHVEDINFAAPSTEEPLAANAAAPPVAIAAPQPSAERPAGSVLRRSARPPPPRSSSTLAPAQ